MPQAVQLLFAQLKHQADVPDVSKLSGDVEGRSLWWSHQVAEIVFSEPFHSTLTTWKHWEPTHPCRVPDRKPRILRKRTPAEGLNISYPEVFCNLFCHWTFEAWSVNPSERHAVLGLRICGNTAMLKVLDDFGIGLKWIRLFKWWNNSSSASWALTTWYPLSAL